MASLGNDLAAIRKELDMSIEDVHAATKIPPHVLQSIEDDSIFSDLSQNKTYIRSYVRSYAKALKIDDDLTVKALDQVEEGTYSGLLQKASGDKPRTTFQYGRSTPDKEGQDDTAPPKDDMVHDHAPPEKKAESTPETPPDTSEGVPSPPSVNSVDWADMGKKFTPLQKSSRVWVGVAVLAIVVVAIGAFIYLNNYRNGGPAEDNRTPETTTAVKPDSLQLNLGSPVEKQDDTTGVATQQPARELPDTLDMVIYAAYGKLEPVRVYSDVIGSLNPYWIEQGDAVKFEFVNTIRLRGQYSRMVLMLNGHNIRNFLQRFMNPESGMLEISRSTFEGEEKWLNPPPDSLDLDVPPPNTISDRPIFN